MPLFFILLLLLGLNLSSSTDIDIDLNPRTANSKSRTLTELDSQLTQQLSSGSTAFLDVTISEIVGSNSGSRVVEEIFVEVPTSELSENDKNKLKTAIESDVADTLDGIVRPGDDEFDKNSIRKVQKLFEDEKQAAEELNEMQNELEIALKNLPESGQPTGIDIVVTDHSDKDTIEEIVVAISASSGTGPRLTDNEKTEIEKEIVDHVADTLGAIIINDFVNIDESADANKGTAEKHLEKHSYLENLASEQPPPSEKVEQAKPKQAEPYAFRGAAMATAHDHPMFAPHRWQTPLEEQMWAMKLSILTCSSCVALLMIMGVWTQIRRTGRRAAIDDSHFRWAEAVEYMDAFPYEP
ncbi:hypothetical protein PHYBOEH_007549 [Phytophthora boehmeriae]|uniref:Uncharacterized protein n=1 Tax=Phytophthora boehmeriae TaxID=109152 RepID=A0A8T1W7D9_9STRA|nr:hypothetical protein PHYBOEH_007549 [Phytophthora boehmeriae]